MKYEMFREKKKKVHKKYNYMIWRLQKKNILAKKFELRITEKMQCIMKYKVKKQEPIVGVFHFNTTT